MAKEKRDHQYQAMYSQSPYSGAYGYPGYGGSAGAGQQQAGYQQGADYGGAYGGAQGYPAAAQGVPSYSGGYPSGGAFPYAQTGQQPQAGGPAGVQMPGMLPLEESYIENILRLNRGKPATVYMTFENNKEWNAKIFKGIVEAAGRDHIILSDPETGMRYLLLMIYLDYITFEEELEYDYPFGAGGQGLSSYTPR